MLFLYFCPDLAIKKGELAIRFMSSICIRWLCQSTLWQQSLWHSLSQSQPASSAVPLKMSIMDSVAQKSVFRLSFVIGFNGGGVYMRRQRGVQFEIA